MVIVSYPRLLVMNLTSTQRRRSGPHGVALWGFPLVLGGCFRVRTAAGQATELNCCVAAVGASVSSASP